jgi:MFS family permease
MRHRYFYGWNVVAATFVMALFSFGLGFSGLSVYAAALQRAHGWSASAVSMPITTYYVAGALLTLVIGTAYERLGPRVVVSGASLAMAVGLAALGAVTAPWHLYPVFLVMSIGWGAMSGAAINLILAPWFHRRRGLAVSLAFNGATLGGVIVAPAVLLLVERTGLAPAVAVAAVALALAVPALAIGVMRRGPAALGLGLDGDPPAPVTAAPMTGGRRWRAEALCTWRFWSVSAPFALGLTAQVGLITHLVALVTPVLGPGGAARAVSLTAAVAVLGRLGTGLIVDRVNRRAVASATLAIQVVGVGLLAAGTTPAALYAGCALFGAGVGNLTTLPGLILGGEWPPERFGALVSLAVGINQFTFAFGPSLVGLLRDRAGDYGDALIVCAGLQALGAIVVLLGPRTAPETRPVGLKARP